MKPLLKIVILTISFCLLLLMISSCGKKQTLIYNNPALQHGTGFYERAWVDPQIKYTDSLITIIKASRVDSFYVDKPAPKFKDGLISLAFEVKEPNCFTSVLPLDNFGNLLSVLVADELSVGYYKVTLQSSQISYVQPSAERFFLKVDFCGFSVIEEIR